MNHVNHNQFLTRTRKRKRKKKRKKRKRKKNKMLRFKKSFQSAVNLGRARRRSR
ncbi:hypothetical protein Hanom_Chr05g00465431 [Helianthus anomalus]